MRISFNPINFTGTNCNSRAAFNRIHSSKPLATDVFERKVFDNVKIKDVEIKDSKGKSVNAVIKKTNKEGRINRYYIFTEGAKEPLGYAITRVADEGKGLYLSDLYTEDHTKRGYKGAGTELLKCVVEESFEKGMGGKVYVDACNVPPPYAFYYKNNFRASSISSSMYNAGIDYAVRYDVPAEKVFPRWGAIEMKLDEDGAKALLAGDRLFEKRNFETLGTKKSKDGNFEAFLIQAPKDDEKYFLVADKNAKKDKMVYTGKMKAADDNQAVELSMVYDWVTDSEIEDWVFEMLNLAVDKMGYKKFFLMDD